MKEQPDLFAHVLMLVLGTFVVMVVVDVCREAATARAKLEMLCRQPLPVGTDRIPGPAQSGARTLGEPAVHTPPIHASSSNADDPAKFCWPLPSR